MALVTIAEFPIDEVLPFTGRDAPKREYAGYMVNMDSQRYQVFKRANGCRCVFCGLVGTIMRLEYNGSDPTRHLTTAHFNLYGIHPENGQWIMLTKDHVVPKSRGGTNSLNNLRPMCSPCNGRRGNRVDVP